MKTILITGSEGFVGTYIVKLLKESLNKIVPCCYPLLRPKRGKYSPLDILNLEMTQEVIKANNPDIIFHLAAISSVAKSFKDRPITYNTNVIGTLNLLEAAQNLNKKVKFIFVSTCEIYGGGENISETAEIVLKNPYAITKYTAELICKDYSSEGVDWIILRPFNHTGPGQAEDFVLPTIAKQIAEIEKGTRPPLVEIGNTDIKREFMNIQDIVEAYKLAIEKCEPKEIYNISSNQGHTIGQAIAILQSLSKTKFEVKIDPAKIRKLDILTLVGNGEKFHRLTGWCPKIKFEKTIEDLLNYWRAKI